MTLPEFSANLEYLRKKLHLTQAQLAQRVGVQRSFITAIEKGAQNVTLQTISRLAKALEVQPAQLFSSTTDDFTATPRTTPLPVTFLKLGGTWDMIATDKGLQGTGQLDDQALADLERQHQGNQLLLVQALENTFKETEPLKQSLSSHLFWVKDLERLITGNFYPLYSGDSSQARPALFAAIIGYILRCLRQDPSTPLICGTGTDTVDLLLGLLDPLLFDQKVHPVIMTGANRSHREDHSDAPQNFSDAALATHLPLQPGAHYIFNHALYHGGDMTKVDPREEPQSLEGMMTFFAPHRTQAKLGFLQFPTGKKQKPTYSGREFHSYTTKKIFEALQSIVTVNLGDLNPLEHELDKIRSPKFPAVIIVGHALGNVPRPIREAAIEAARDGKLILSASRCLVPSTSERYAVSLSSANQRELKHESSRIIDGSRVNTFAAHGLLLRAILENRTQRETQKMLHKYLASFSEN